VPPRLGLRVAVAFLLVQTLLLVALAFVFPGVARAQSVKADLSVNTSAGYARLVFRFSEDIDADVRLANGILIVSFKQPVQVSVDRLSTNAPGYVSAARRDPDGKGLRIALSRKVTVNHMAAGERLFVDLLPESWTAAPPSLPQEVIEELNKRARDAERRVRQERQLVQQKRVAPIRVRVSHQPTFSRYVFELPELIAISNSREKEKLILVFDAPLRFDLADAKAAPPPMVESVETEIGDTTTSVQFAFIGHVDIRAFREDNNYIVDVGGAAGKSKRSDAAPAITPPRAERAEENAESQPAPVIAAPQTVPAKPSGPPAVAAAPPPAPAAAPPQATPATKLAEPVPPPAPAAKVVEAPAQPAAPASSAAAEPAAVPPPVNAAPQIAAAAPVPAAPEPPPAPAPAPTQTAAPGDAPVKQAAPLPHDATPSVVAELRRQSDNLRLTFPFTAPTASAVYRRGDTLWLVFDSSAPIDAAALNKDPSGTIRGVTVERSGEGQVVRIKLERPRLTSLTSEGPAWTVIVGETVMEPTKPVSVVRNVGIPRPNVMITFDSPQKLHRLADPEVGDALFVVTGFGPARGLLKTQEFVEFRALASTHGVVVEPIADDVIAELASDKVVVGRPGGLTLSSGLGTPRRTSNYRPVMFDSQLWGFDRQAPFFERQVNLIQAAASAPESKRSGPRFDLARFYLSRDMFAEAKGVLDVALGDERPTAEDATGLVLRAIANIMLGRTEAALKDLSNPLVGNQNDAPMWRALALARQGKWSEAREGFRNVEVAMGALPLELQRLALKEAVRASIEVRDFSGAASRLNEFETLGVPKDLEPTVAVLTGRLAEGLGRSEDALAAYRSAAESPDRPSAARGRLHEIILRYQLGDLKRGEVISELETLTTLWRGDDTEIEALQLLARLYTDENRYRDAFYVMRTAITAHPTSEMTRRIHDEAAATFDQLFLAGKGDAMPAIDALSLFYDFRELTPIGRRGDEMIRRLADRLVSVDLLDQAAELLQHQVDHRLQGAARAQVATRLAVIYLMNRKPDRGLATLRSTRTADLSNELRNQRLLLEARALSDIGRHDLALEIIVNMDGREGIRLRADIHWAARRWRESAEQIELLFGERWRDFEPLNDAERADVLRAAIGYALAEDQLGMQRFREKFAAKMAEGPDRRAFETITTSRGTSSAEFRDVARMVAAVDTLEGFLREMRARYPESGTAIPSVRSPGPAEATPPAAAPARPVPRPNERQASVREPETTAALPTRKATARVATR
jgi:tetratricopeptide (TPR) repeat protein